MNRLAHICDKQSTPGKKPILLSEISRFPNLIPCFAQCFGKQWHKEVATVHKLLNYKDSVGFTLFTSDQLSSLIGLLSVNPAYKPSQHPVIPPRIWKYQVERLEQCLNDYLIISPELQALVKCITDARKHNQSIVDAKVKCRRKKFTRNVENNLVNPFAAYSKLEGSVKFKCSFKEMLIDFGILKYVQRYENVSDNITQQHLNTIIFGFQSAAMAYIQFFSMQRRSEALSMRVDCLQSEKDERFGSIYLLVGETTKTIEDDDARWVVPKRITLALDVLTHISKILYQFVPKHLKCHDRSVPLWINSFLPSNGGSQPAGLTRRTHYSHFSNLFEKDSMRINQADFEFAKAITNDLENRPEYQVDKIWHWTSHQCRRTLIVYMLSSGKVKLASVQYLAKHLYSHMAQYYGRNYTKIVVNSSVENELIVESYLAKAKKVQEIHNRESKVVFPHKTSKAFDKISSQEETLLIASFKNGEIGCRPTLLGFCLKSGYCEYGGIESITKCMGADGGGICAEAVLAIDNQQSLHELKIKYQAELASISPRTRRAKSLQYEIKAIQIYEEYIDV